MALGWSTVDGWVRRHRWAVDCGLAVVLAALTAPVTVRVVWGGGWSVTLEIVGTALVGLGHAAVAVRRSLPRVAFAVAGGLVLFLAVTPPLAPEPGAREFSAVLVPSVLVFPVVLYSVAAWCPRRTSQLALGATGIGSVLVLVRLWGADYLTVSQPGLATADEPVRSWPLFLVLGLAGMALLPWGAGRYRRLRLLYVAQAEQRATERERRRIAREMHDVVAHSLSVLVTQAEGGRLMADKDPAATASVLDTIARTGRDAMRDMSCVLQVMDRPAGGTAEVEQPQPGLAELPDLVAQVARSGLTVRFDEVGTPHRMTGAAQLTAYRVVQEALTNVLKHAGTEARTHLTLRWPADGLDLAVTNTVVPGHHSTGGSGRGLRGMDERVSALGGTLRVESAGDRFTVRAHLPLAVGDGSAR